MYNRLTNFGRWGVKPIKMSYKGPTQATLRGGDFQRENFWIFIFFLDRNELSSKILQYKKKKKIERVNIYWERKRLPPEVKLT